MESLHRFEFLLRASTNCRWRTRARKRYKKKQKKNPHTAAPWVSGVTTTGWMLVHETMSSALLNVQHMPDVQLEAAISTTIIAKMHRKKGTILLYTGSCCRVSALSLECSEFKSKAKSDKWDCRNPATATKSHLTFTKNTLYIYLFGHKAIYFYYYLLLIIEL